MGFILLGQGGAFPNLVKAIPPAQEVRVGPSEHWQIKEIYKPANPLEREDLSKPLTVKLRGKRYVIRPTSQFPQLGEMLPGSDGTLLICRISRGEWSFSGDYQIFDRGKETPVPMAVTFYLDRRNYVGYTQEDGLLVTHSSPEAHVVFNGASKKLGPGIPNYLGRDGLVVVDTPVDNSLMPSGQDLVEGFVATVHSETSSISVPQFRFFAREPDGVVDLRSYGAYQSAPLDFVFRANQKQDTDNNLLKIRDGKVLQRQRMPNGWDLIKQSSSGWNLSRRWPTRAEHESVDETYEQFWNFGIMRGNVITPLTFKRPKGTEKLLWREGDEKLTQNSIVFHAFWGNVDRWFKLSRVAH